jgi:ArsR family transcriptional regulator
MRLNMDNESRSVNISPMAAPQKSLRARPEGCCAFKPVRALGERRQERLVGTFKALSDPTRLEMLRLLRGQAGPTCVCDIVDHFELSQPTISHHLKVLKDAGLLTHSKVGIWSFYAPGEEAAALLAEAERLLA